MHVGDFEDRVDTQLASGHAHVQTRRVLAATAVAAVIVTGDFLTDRDRLWVSPG